MLKEAQIHSVALFFFYSLMDEQSAFQATVKTIEKCRKRISKGQNLEANINALVIQSMFDVWQSLMNKSTSAHFTGSFEQSWKVPDKIDLGPWQEFRRLAEPDEMLAVIWSKLLTYSDAEIANGLNVSVGTVRHRVSRGLRALGHLQRLEAQ